MERVNVDQVMGKALASGVSLGLPGIAVAIVDEKTDATWSGVDGWSDIQKQTPMARSDRFCVGSITKTFVAVVILQLVDEGKLELDKTASDYLFARDSSPHQQHRRLLLLRLMPNINSATLRHLLSHQSGIPTWEFQPEWIKAGRGCNIQRDKIWGKDETLLYLSGAERTFKPGERFSYSNTNFTILGLVIESVTGNDVTIEIKNRILDPLQLQNTYLDSFQVPPPNGSLTCHYHFATPDFVRAAGLSDSAFGRVSLRPDLIETTATNLSTEWVAGGMVMSIGELVLYGKALLCDRNALLSESMRHEMFTYRPPECDIMGSSALGTQRQSLLESGEQYCQGVCRETTTVFGEESFGHGGLTLGFCSKLLCVDDDLVIACATNVGIMHSGFESGTSPWEIFVSSVLLPAVKKAFRSEPT